MPIYEYRCRACGRTFEKLRKFSDPPLTLCDCGVEGQVERLLSPPAFHLKGGGWYKDGYGAGKSSSSDTSSKTEPKTTPSKSDSTSSDSKPATSDSKPSTPAPATSSSSDK